MKNEIDLNDIETVIISCMVIYFVIIAIWIKYSNNDIEDKFF